MPDVSMIIAGERRAARSTFGVVNPATGEVHAQAPDCTAEQLDEAFDAAAKAFVGWRGDEDARRAALAEAANRLTASADQIGPVLTAEQGKPLKSAKREAFGAGYWLKYFSQLEIPREVIQDDARARVEVVRRPVGVVAAITPWNFPIMLATWKIAPALLAGNTMVLKPSPFTPRSTLLMAEILSEVFPPGVLNVVSGGDELGRWMTWHPTPRKISFTGSIATGKHIAASAAPDLKRLTLELGGNDPAILLDDVDPAAIVEKLFRGAFDNSGQVCSAIKRLYVPEALHDQVADALAARVAAARVGDGMDPDTELGPVQNRPQYERVGELVADALAGGATALTGGAPVGGPGYFFQPTVITGAVEGTRIVDEEQFGPVLPILPYRDVDEVVARANATTFGLSGSVWSADPDRAGAVAERLECGTAWVNAHVALGPHQPFGGARWSGLGVENGPWGLAGYTDIQVQHRARG
ncbi:MULTISPECIES: aldehyde dehydrogenase family protein [unclassified Parafrankia]|uniref:aldehyde dehydrogenase family protein n=1 Tax=unclassified Parafrankia TaxID=2994368 RepID=UPI000DA44F9E|nr:MULTISPECIES: aldehyde dehydrogenase family protein [unclassified Parafrankia]TCJ31860.1 aldehyde dehydrogenase family protein [Parafrankia sp. BMG5.11]SQD94178.1 Aldehyde Dehydrogenase [Parafrankia sp. Ea1.12]